MDDPERRKPDITLARSHLAWFPQVPLAEGIAKTIDYFDDLLTSSSKNVYRP
jgi:UDP-glucuronate decarboxylase